MKKNINTPQFTRLEKSSETRAKEAKVEIKKKISKSLQQMQICKLETKEAKNYAQEAKHSAKQAKVLLLKTKKDSEEAIAKFKLETQQPKAILKKHK